MADSCERQAGPPSPRASGTGSNAVEKQSLGDLLRKVHEDEQGAVSLETILIVGAIAIPILLFLLKIAWPRIKAFFDSGMSDLETSAKDVSNGSAN